jgi:hypothetical protein
MAEAQRAPRVSDILSPEAQGVKTNPSRQDKGQEQRSPQRRFNDIGTGRSRSEQPRGGERSPSRYRQLQESLRIQRNGQVNEPVQPENTPEIKGSTRNQAKTSQTRKSKLSKITVLLMVTVALIIDIVQFLSKLIVIGFFFNDIIDIPIELGFFIWFKMNGVDFNSTRKILSFVGAFAVGIITDSVIPTWTAEIVLIILAERAQEKQEQKNSV